MNKILSSSFRNPCRAALWLILLLPMAAFCQGSMIRTPYQSPAALGRAGIYTTLGSDDPWMPLSNPGILGLASMRRQLTIGLNPTETDLSGGFSDELHFGSGVVNVGTGLLATLPGQIPVSFGLGLHRGSLVIGETNFRDTADGWGVTLGMGINYIAQAGLGVTLDKDRTRLSYATETNAPVDLGWVVQVPLMNAVHQLLHRPRATLRGLEIEVTPSVAFAAKDLGNKSHFDYSDPNRPDEDYSLYRSAHAHAGLALELGLPMEDGSSWQLLAVETAVEGDDYLGGNPSARGFFYRVGLGDIRFWNDLVLGKSNKQIDKTKGWEIGLLSAVYLRGGVEDYGSYSNDHDFRGIGLRLGGFLELARHIQPAIAADSGISFLLRHVDVQYDYGEHRYPHYMPAYDTYDGSQADVYQGIRIVLR